MHDFLDALSAYGPLSAETTAALAGVLRKTEVSRGSLLVRPGSVCRHIYFVSRGLTRTFYVEDGRDITDWFSPEGTFACSILSFLSGEPDRRGIEALEDSLLFSLYREDLEALYAHYWEVERLGRLLVSDGLIMLQRRFDELHFTPALQRYRKMLDRAPTLVQRVPLGMLASYLGITPETLSRIRRRK